MPGLHGVRQLALGGTHSLAVLEGGQLLAWGANQNGLLGLGSEAEMNARLPTPVPGVSCEQASAPGLCSLGFRVWSPWFLGFRVYAGECAVGSPGFCVLSWALCRGARRV